MAESSVVLKLLDKLTPELSAVRRATEQTGKSFDEMSGKVSALRSRYETMNETTAKMQVQLEGQKKLVQEMSAAWKKSGEEIDRVNFETARESLNNLTNQTKEWEAATKEARKEYVNLRDELRKMEDGGSGSGSGAGAALGYDSLTSWGMMASGWMKQLGSAATGAADFVLSSSLGSTDASLVNSILGGAASGAAIGSLGGIGVGTAVGAAVGGVSGLIEGITARAEAEDDAFRGYRDDLISTITQNDADALSAGISTAAQREQDRIAFSALLGDSAVSTVLLNSIKELANTTPYVYDDLTGIARQLAIFDSTSEDLYDNLVTIGDAGSALGMTASTMEGLAQVLGKIGDSETYQSTYTRSLRNYGINPASVFAEYFGISTQEANTLMTSGKLSGADAMDAILSVLGSRFGGMMERQAHTYAGALSTRQGLEAELQNFMGEGYTSLRSPSLADHNAWMESFYQSKAFSAIGRAMAWKENTEDALYRDIFGGIFGGQEIKVADDEIINGEKGIVELRERWLDAQREQMDLEAQLNAAQEAGDEERAEEIGQKLMENGVDIQRIHDDAQSLYQQATDTEDSFSVWRKSALETLMEIGAQVADIKGYLPSYEYGKAQEKGLKANSTALDMLIGVAGTMNPLVRPLADAYFPSAVGKNVIPHNDFPILAHEGEMLLTASEARAYRAGGDGRIVITGNTFNVRQESDIDAIADAIARKLELAAFAME